MLFSSSLYPNLCLSVVFCIPSSSVQVFGNPALFRWIDFVQYRLENVFQYVQLPHVGVVFALWVLRCLDVPTSPFLLRSLSLVRNLVGSRLVSSLVCIVLPPLCFDLSALLRSLVLLAGIGKTPLVRNYMLLISIMLRLIMFVQRVFFLFLLVTLHVFC